MIQFENINKQYKQNIILSNISFTINKGEVCVLIGPSGSGKTTLLKMINRLIKPTKGKIYLNKKDIENQEIISYRRNIGYVIQQTGLFPHMTIAQNIEIIPKLQGFSKDIVRKRTLELMDMVSLDIEYLDRYPAQLSGGQQQRIGVARALTCNPDVILMDEPFSALDPITRLQLQEELLLLQSKLKKTVVFVTHDMDEAVKIADKICILHNGEIAQHGTPEEILKNPNNKFVREFVGKHRIWANPNLIYAKDIMVKSPFVTLKTTVLNAVKVIKENNFSTLPVVDNDNKLLGIIERFTIENYTLKDELIQNLIEKDFSKVLDSDSIISILKIASDKDINNIPVVNSLGKLEGIITKNSLITTLSHQYLSSKEVV